MGQELPKLGALKVPSERKSASYFNAEALSGILFAGPLGGVIGSVIGHSRQNSEVEHGYREVAEPTMLNRDALAGWGVGGVVGTMAGVGLAVATGGVSLIPTVMGLGGVAVGSYLGGRHGKARMAQEYAEAIEYNQSARQERKPQRGPAQEPEQGVNSHLPQKQAGRGVG